MCTACNHTPHTTAASIKTRESSSRTASSSSNSNTRQPRRHPTFALPSGMVALHPWSRHYKPQQLSYNSTHVHHSRKRSTVLPCCCYLLRLKHCLHTTAGCIDAASAPPSLPPATSKSIFHSMQAAGEQASCTRPTSILQQGGQEPHLPAHTPTHPRSSKPRDTHNWIPPPHNPYTHIRVAHSCCDNRLQHMGTAAAPAPVPTSAPPSLLRASHKSMGMDANPCKCAYEEEGDMHTEQA